MGKITGWLWVGISVWLALALVSEAGELTSEVRVLNGKPALLINGEPVNQVLAAPYRPGLDDFKDFLRAGIRIFNIYLRFDWTGPEKYDFSRIDRKLEPFLEEEPEALFIPRILLTPGPWYCERFPDEITMRDDGSPAGMFGGPCHPSLASEVYRDLSRKAMAAFIAYVEGRYGDNIVGYQVGNGFGGEWLMFNSFWEMRPGGEPPARFGVEDYSPPSKAGFRSWLRARYRRVGDLRRAWGDPDVDFETAEPPGEVERCSPTHGIFFDPAVSRRVPDFFSYFNDTVAGVLLENAAWVKSLTGRKKIVGAFYGYLWCNFPNLSVNHTGHLGMAEVFNSPDIDFIASPYTYDNKQVGGPNNSQTLPESAAMHGKLYFNEVDTETHLHQRQWRWGESLNLPRNWEQTRGLLIRDFGYALTKGFGMWWTDLHGGTYHDSRILDLLDELRKVGESGLGLDRSSTAEIAVILDEESFKFFGDGEPLFNALLTAQKQWELGYMGAPWEPYLLTDLDHPGMRDFKLYIFLNTFRVTPRQRDVIHARLERNRATAVWVYAPGYIGADLLTLEGMRALTGIRISQDEAPGELRVKITRRDHPYTRSLSDGFAYGTDVDVENIIRWYDHRIYLKDPRDPSLIRDLPGFRIAPRFWAEDPDALVLGRLAGLDRPGLVVKPQPGGWTSVYSSAPVLRSALLRNIAAAAGCHIYSDAGDVVSADRNFLCVYAPAGGTRTIRIPEESRVTGALDGGIVTEGASEFSMTMEPNSAVLLRIEPRKKR